MTTGSRHMFRSGHDNAVTRNKRQARHLPSGEAGMATAHIPHIMIKEEHHGYL